MVVNNFPLFVKSPVEIVRLILPSRHEVFPNFLKLSQKPRSMDISDMEEKATEAKRLHGVRQVICRSIQIGHIHDDGLGQPFPNLHKLSVLLPHDKSDHLLGGLSSCLQQHSTHTEREPFDH